MLSQKTKQTNKKFYGKWLYKVSFLFEGCALLRSKSFNELENFCNGPDPDSYRHSLSQRAWNNRESLLKLCSAVKPYPRDIYNLRIESNILDIYTNDPDFYSHASTELEEFVRNRFEPSDSNIDLLNENKNHITVTKLPKGRYNYRVYLLPHKMSNDKEAKQRYLDWLKLQTPRVTCTPAIEKWFLNTDYNWDRRYILVEDESTLLMLKLRNAEVVGRIYNFVLSDK